jgi:DNA polymerase-1
MNDQPRHPEFNVLLPGDHLVLIDASAFLFRAFYALPALSRSTDGQPTGAINGFCEMLWGVLNATETANFGSQPTHVAVVLDAETRNFRHELYPAYKSNRPPRPDDLKRQMPFLKQAIEAFSLPWIEQPGYEADDLMASYACHAKEEWAEATIVSPDKDLTQLMTDDIRIYDPVKKRIVTREDVIEKFGVPPELVAQAQALIGDTSDHVPGVPKIGPGAARELLDAYGSLDGIYDNIDAIKQKVRKQNLIDHKANAYLSLQLVTLERELPLPVPVANLVRRPIDPVRLGAFFSEMEFATLSEKLDVPYDGPERVAPPAPDYDEDLVDF